jgi:hypothetical protein
MKGVAQVEHIWAPPEVIATKIRSMFPLGAAVVFADEEFVAAIPATAEQTDKLADMMEDVATEENKFEELAKYTAYREELCCGKPIGLLSKAFELAMMQEKTEEENPFAKLASAARFN